MLNFAQCTDCARAFKTLNGNVLTLDDPFIEADLCENLNQAPGKYTRLMISTGVGFEEFTVMCVGNCIKLSPAPSTVFNAGDPVWFESCSKANIKDTINCLEDEDEIDTQSGFKIEGYVLTTDDDGNECWVVDPALKEVVKFQVGKQIITIDGTGCATASDAPVGTYPTPGVYEYPTVTVTGDCQYGSIQNGTKPVCSCCGGCCGDKEKTGEVTNAGVA